MSAFALLTAATRRLPAAWWPPLLHLLGVGVALWPTPGIRQWQHNASIVTGSRPTRAQTARAVQLWARNLLDSAALPGWGPERIEASVVISPADRERLLRLHHDRAEGRGGAVVALPHLGSWDLAGAWACANQMPVSTVAEQIPDFEHFAAAREALGMRVHPHTDPRVIARLAADQRAGHLVCLVADRNLGRGGIEVSWPTATGAHPVRVPAGAVHLARRTNATLLGAAAHYLDDGRMQLVFSEPIAPAEPAVMAQQLVDFMAARVREHVTDWHVLVPFFDQESTPPCGSGKV